MALPHEIQRERARASFGAVAANYATSASHAFGSDLARLLEMTPLRPTDRVLDVGTGAGHTAFAFAPHVASVVASDITEQMLEEVRRGAAERGLGNISVRAEAPAEALPFPNESFDVVVTRVAAHHFADVPAFLGEAHRVLLPGSHLVVCDTITPDDDPAAAEWLEEIELLRDPSHARNWSPAGWRHMAEDAGFTLERQASNTSPSLQVFDAWTRRTNVPPDRIERLLRLFVEALPSARAWVHLEERPVPERYTFALPQLLAVFRKGATHAVTMP